MNDTPHPPFPAPVEEVHLSDYLSVLFRRRKIFLLTFFIVVVGVTLFTFLTKPIYEATATLHVRDDKVKGKGLLDDLGLSRENPVQTEIEILKSRTNAEEVVRRLHLDWRIDKKSPGLNLEIVEFSSRAARPAYKIVLTGGDSFEVFDERGDSLGRAAAGKLLQGKDMQLLVSRVAGKSGDSLLLSQASFNDVVGGLRSGFRATEVGKGTNIIKVSYQGQDPVLAANVVNTLAQVYLERSVAIKSEEASRSVDFIGTQLGQVRESLDTAEQELEGYKSSTGVVSLDSEAQNLIEMAAATERELASIKLRRHQATFAADALREALVRKQSYAPSVLLDDPVVAALAQKLAAFEVERRGQEIALTDDHPVMRNLIAQIAELQQKLLANYESIRQGLVDREQALQQQLAGHESVLKTLPAAERDLARLTRLARVNADIYTFLLQKHEEARIAKAATISSINVIDPAIAPDRPVKPQKKKNLLLGLVVGLMLGVGVVFFLEYMDDTVKDPEMAKRIFGWPILAWIPFIPGQQRDESLPREGTLVGHLEPKSAPAEAFRSLRTAIRYSAINRQKKVLLITSSFPGEGKTTVSANLAVVLAQTGARVLLIGCDLRRPTLHEIFGHSRIPGLVELLSGDAGLAGVKHDTGIANFDFISAGTTPPNPAELLGSEQMRQLLLDLSEQYDHIVIDAPPSLAVTDAQVLTTMVDLVMVVLEAGRVPLKAARQLQELLATVKAPVAGLILNDKSRSQEGYYGSYGYYGGYYGDDDKAANGKKGWFATLRGKG